MAQQKKGWEIGVGLGTPLYGVNEKTLVTMENRWNVGAQFLPLDGNRMVNANLGRYWALGKARKISLTAMANLYYVTLAQFSTSGYYSLPSYTECSSLMPTLGIKLNYLLNKSPKIQHRLHTSVEGMYAFGPNLIATSIGTTHSFMGVKELVFMFFQPQFTWIVGEEGNGIFPRLNIGINLGRPKKS